MRDYGVDFAQDTEVTNMICHFQPTSTTSEVQKRGFKPNHSGYQGDLWMSQRIQVDFSKNCLGCGDENHMKKNCPHPDLVCKYCNKFGHSVKVCYKLHGICARCRCRGHVSGDCDKRTKPEWRQIFKLNWPLGLYTNLCGGDLTHPFGFQSTH